MDERTAGLTPEAKRELLGRLLAERLRYEQAFPLSFAQERLWFIEQFQPGQSVYNVPLVLRFPGPLQHAALGWALGEVVRRHEVLRTTFSTENGRPVQRIGPPGPVDLPVTDLGDLPEHARQAATQRIAGEEAATVFDLSRGPLLRARLLRLDAQDHILLLTMHHIVSDGWSTGVLMRELGELVGAFAAGRPADLPDLPLQYADFAGRQRRRLSGERLAGLIEYWRGQLAGASGVIDLPADRPRPPVQTFAGATQPFRVDATVTDGLRRLTRAENATVFMTLLAAFAVLLARHSGQRDLTIGTPIANRNDAEIEPLIGFFVNTLVLRADLEGDPTFRELLQHVRGTTLDAFAHQDLPFERLVEELQPARRLSHSPLFQVMFSLQNVPTLPVEEGGAADEQGVDDVAPPPIYIGTAKFDLTLTLAETGTGLTGAVEYNTDLFDHSTITRMIGHYRTLVAAVAADPDRPISELPLLTAAERHLIVEDWNATARPFPADRRPHELFEEQADRTPDNVAVVAGDATLTYRELDERSNRLARHLLDLGAGPGVPVGLCLERCPELVVGVMGIAKAGAAYLPLDPTYPQARLAFMLDDADAPIVLTLDRFAGEVPGDGRAVVRLDGDWEAIAAHPAERQAAPGGPDDVMAVFYTSGSTGKPKGTLVPGRGFTNLFTWFRDVAEMGEPTRTMLMTPFSFDASFKAIMSPLLAGGSVALAPNVEHDLDRLVRAIEADRPTTCFVTPSLLYALVELTRAGGYRALSSFEHVFVGGEATDLRRLRPWLTHRNRTCRVSHIYGPSECADVSTIHTTTDEELAAADSWPIGRPIANARAYVLGPDLDLLPIGAPGELCISGAGVGDGYLGRPELTAERFVPDPYAPGLRLYRTGDRARWQPEGEVEFLGRLDDQVKIRGIRIEPGEVESAVAALDEVSEATVVAGDDPGGGKRLVGYVVPADGATPTPESLRAALTRTLPAYMVPGRFVVVDALPRSPNGKVDKAALPPPDTGAGPRRGDEDMGPVEHILAAIWVEVLGVGHVGPSDDFFDLGGHSLLATQVMSRVRDAFDVEVPLRHIFEAPTVAGLAQAMLADERDGPKIEKAAGLLLEVASMGETEVDARLARFGRPPAGGR